MSTIDPPAGWDEVDGINTNERLLGGPSGPLNRAVTGLTARTKQLRAVTEVLSAQTADLAQRDEGLKDQLEDIFPTLAESDGAEKIGFKPSGQGTRNQSVFSILNSPLRPRSMTGYTATGDCTEAVQNAIQLASDTNRTLLIEEPLKVGQLLLNPGTRIECGGPRSAGASGVEDGSGFKPSDDIAINSDDYWIKLNPNVDPQSWAYRGVQLYNLNMVGNMNTFLANGKRFGGLQIDNTSSPSASINPRHRIEGGFFRGIPGTAIFIGNRTHDGYYAAGTIYQCLGHGLYYGGVDSQIEGWNIGRAYGHGLYIRGSELRLSNIKSWLSGYVDGSPPNENPGYVPDINPLNSCGVYIYRAAGVNGTNIMTQENARHGTMLAFSGLTPESQPWFIEDVNLMNVDSDGDNRQGATGRPAFYLDQVRRCRLVGTAGNRNPAFVGGPTYGVHLTNSENQGNFIDVNGSVPSWLAAPTSTFGGNGFSLNQHKSRYSNVSVTGSYTPNPITTENYVFSMGDVNFTVANPAVKPKGFRLRLEFLQTSPNARTISFGTDFKLPQGWNPTSVMTKSSLIIFVCDGVRWTPESFVNEF